MEPERYELNESPAYQFSLSRREFIEIAGVGLLISVAADAQTGGGLAARLHLGEDGAVTVLTGKVECGQGARSEIAMAAAEELGIGLERVRLIMADTKLVPNDGITAGSRTTPSTLPAVRKAAAAARTLLAHSGKKDYAELARAPEYASTWQKAAPADVTLQAVKDWKILGTSQGRPDAREVVTGAHRYPSDIVRKGMLYAAVLRPPVYGATLDKIDLTPAKKIPGVVAVEESGFVGCAAPSSYAARKAVEAVAETAKYQVLAQPSSDHLYEFLKQNAIWDGPRKPRVQIRGNIEQGFDRAARRIKSEYHVPFIQHAPMEPRAAVAEWENGSLTVWTGTQNPFGVRDQLAQAFRLPSERVRVIVPDFGGGFGGKHTGEVAIEAARLAKEAGRPVSLRWTRQEEFAWAYFRPAGVFQMEGGLDADGRLTAWDYINYNAGTAAMETPYAVPNTRTQFVYTKSPLREGSYRGIAATANTFARECFMDELAAAAKLDPLEFRLRNTENPRLRDVLTAAADKFRWKERVKSQAKGRAVGIAGGTEKGSYVAACVEVEIGASVKIRDFTMAYECGAILNPSNLRAQVEGSIIQGLGGALTEAIEFENGRLRNGSFLRYRVPRFRDVPPLQIVLLDREDLPSAGAGETPIIAVAPAIANAVSAATGHRVHAMPVRVAQDKATG
ncbi:MAG: molybdopterin cofactor-binding domain-containing protein [Bryobacteraceae bacterium]